MAQFIIFFTLCALSHFAHASLLRKVAQKGYYSDVQILACNPNKGREKLYKKKDGQTVLDILAGKPDSEEKHNFEIWLKDQFDINFPEPLKKIRPLEPLEITPKATNSPNDKVTALSLEEGFDLIVQNT